MSPKVDRVRLRARKNAVPLTKAERLKRRRDARIAEYRARRATPVSTSPLRFAVNVALLVISVLGGTLQFVEYRRHIQGAHGLWLAAYVLVAVYAGSALSAQLKARKAEREARES